MKDVSTMVDVSESAIRFKIPPTPITIFECLLGELVVSRGNLWHNSYRKIFAATGTVEFENHSGFKREKVYNVQRTTYIFNWHRWLSYSFDDVKESLGSGNLS